MENRLTPEDAMQFVENMYVMAILDREGRYIYVNPGWVEHNVFPIGPGGTLIHVSAEDVIASGYGISYRTARRPMCWSTGSR